jgi:murein L,D-transpeptidase YafK
MKRRCCLLWLMLGLPPLAFAQKIPSSPRSRQATQRCRPLLAASLARQGVAWGAPVFIRIFKFEKRLEMYLHTRDRFTLFRQYDVCTLGGRGPGPKTLQGDGRAPEGFYTIAPVQLNPYSRYHLAFNVGYPNVYDRWHRRTGGHIMVLGRCASIGCFAMTDAAMEEIYTLVDAALRHGQLFVKLHIFPFAMSSQNLSRFIQHPWFAFWMNLKTGHDWFLDNDFIPPDVHIEGGEYRPRAAGQSK